MTCVSSPVELFSIYCVSRDAPIMTVVTGIFDSCLENETSGYDPAVSIGVAGVAFDAVTCSPFGGPLSHA
jgi:hypothetical protein